MKQASEVPEKVALAAAELRSLALRFAAQGFEFMGCLSLTEREEDGTGVRDHLACEIRLHSKEQNKMLAAICNTIAESLIVEESKESEEAAARIMEEIRAEMEVTSRITL